MEKLTTLRVSLSLSLKDMYIITLISQMHIATQVVFKVHVHI